MYEEKVYDIGDNAQELGFAYLFFRYVWPVIVAIVFGAILFLVLRWFLQLAIENPIDFLPRYPLT